MNKIHPFLVILAAIATIPTTYAQTIKVGDAELIYSEDENPIRYDGTISTLRKYGNELCFYHPFGCRFEPGGNRRSRHSWFYGPPEDPLKIHDASRTEEEFWDYNGYYQDTDEEGIWILAMHQLDNGDLLSITHAEINYPQDKTYRFALGLGYSTDKGNHWTYCGEIARAARDTANIGGGAYIFKGDYMYVYYNDADPAAKKKLGCVIRAKIEEVAKAAAMHKVTTWHKYRNGQWDTPGLSNTPGSNIIPRTYGGEDLHADAAYCTALGKYLMTVQTGRAHKLLLFASEDGLNWKQAAIVDETNENVMQPYAAFVDFNGPTDDGRIVDDQFYIYFPRIQLGDPEKTPMYRRSIRIQ
ncbi:MAG: hypothetical protein M1457_10965 [bacterium]|nr:hypothetical protein [bacterium]